MPLRAAVSACKSATTGHVRVGIRLFTGQFRGNKSGNPNGKVVIADGKLLKASADAHAPYSQ
jgi:hypothetical protein